MPLCHADITFRPFPKSNPIPPDVVGLLGGHGGPGDPVIAYALRKNNQEIMIEVAKWEANEEDPNRGADQMYVHYLEIIQSLLTSIAFGKSRAAYLVPLKNGGFRILPRKTKYPAVSCSPWTTMIPISEVEFTSFAVGYDRRGYWKGKPVDIQYAWHPVEIPALDMAMYGCRSVQGMDLTFEIYGHLVAEDGSILGIVSEAAWGRMINFDDRALIYNTIAKLQNRGIIYRGCGTNRFMIANGKVRLIEFNCIVPLRKDELKDMDQLAEKCHWKELGMLFHEFKTYGPYGLYGIPPHRLTANIHNLTFITPLPSPELPLGGIYLTASFFTDAKLDFWPRVEDASEDVQHASQGVSRTLTQERASLERVAHEDLPTRLRAIIAHTIRNRPMAHRPY